MICEANLENRQFTTNHPLSLQGFTYNTAPGPEWRALALTFREREHAWQCAEQKDLREFVHSGAYKEELRSKPRRTGKSTVRLLRGRGKPGSAIGAPAWRGACVAGLGSVAVRGAAHRRFRAGDVQLYEHMI